VLVILEPQPNNQVNDELLRPEGGKACGSGSAVCRYVVCGVVIEYYLSIDGFSSHVFHHYHLLILTVFCLPMVLTTHKQTKQPPQKWKCIRICSIKWHTHATRSVRHVNIRNQIWHLGKCPVQIDVYPNI
jgi:hypothetical protein